MKEYIPFGAISLGPFLLRANSRRLNLRVPSSEGVCSDMKFLHERDHEFLIDIFNHLINRSFTWNEPGYIP